MERLPRCAIAFALLLFACQRAPKSEPVVDAAPPKVVLAPPPHDAGEDAALRPADRDAAKTYLKALDEGRRATRATKYEDARAAFDRALTARKDDPRALAERGYAALLANDLDRAQEDIEKALVLGALDRALEASVQFNRGLVLEKRGKQDDALAAFVLADTLQSTPARKAKRSGTTGCAADLRAQPTDAQSYADWSALDSAVSPIVDRGDAKKSVCIRSHTAQGTPDEDDVCDSPWPWTLFHNHLMFTENEWIVWPHDKEIFAIALGRVGSWPAHCTNLPDTQVTLEHGLIHLATTYDGKWATLDEHATPNPDDAQLQCADVQGYFQEEWIDAKTGKSLIAVRSFDQATRPTIVVTDKTIEIKGGGCDRSLTR